MCKSPEPQSCSGACEGSCCCNHVGAPFGVYPDGTTYTSSRRMKGHPKMETSCRVACRQQHWVDEADREREATKGMTHEERLSHYWKNSYVIDDYLLKTYGIEPANTDKPFDRDGNRIRPVFDGGDLI